MNSSLSAIITVHNKQDTIAKTLGSLLVWQSEFREIIVIDDGSTDKSAEIIKQFADKYNNVRYVFQSNRSVAKSLNAGLRMTDADFVAVLDGDVELQGNWLTKIMPYFKDEEIAAVSGLTKTMNPDNLWAALAGFNVEYRQSKIKGESVDHLSSTNVIFRKSVLDEVGLLDPEFRYGQDNELSYRIVAAGYKLILTKETDCLHFWPESFMGFMRQRMHGAWARVKLIKKHPVRLTGDKVSSLRYFLELPLGSALILSLITAPFVPESLIAAGLLIVLIYIFQFNEILFFFRKRKIIIGILMPVFVLLRAVAWLFGIFSSYYS